MAVVSVLCVVVVVIYIYKGQNQKTLIKRQKIDEKC